jgi:hypothetical protein
LKDLSTKSVWEALEAGRAYVSFDWLADATGFNCAVLSSEGRREMGSKVTRESKLTIHADAPLPVRWKLVRNGKVKSESTGRTLDTPLTEPGNYRVEAWLSVAGEEMIWILSNPFYVRD